jgi:hypothetical protein
MDNPQLSVLGPGILLRNSLQPWSYAAETSHFLGPICASGTDLVLCHIHGTMGDAMCRPAQLTRKQLSGRPASRDSLLPLERQETGVPCSELRGAPRNKLVATTTGEG